jgi:hypothetical protein
MMTEMKGVGRVPGAIISGSGGSLVKCGSSQTVGGSGRASRWRGGVGL